MTDCYNKFKELFEHHVVRLIQLCNEEADEEDFIDALKTLSNEEEKQFILELMLSVSEYTTFCEMMMHYKEHKKEAALKAAEEAGEKLE